MDYGLWIISILWEYILLPLTALHLLGVAVMVEDVPAEGVVEGEMIGESTRFGNLPII